MPKIILAARGRITSRHGQDVGRPFLHRGIDQGHGRATPADLEIKAPAEGIITATGSLGTYGNRLVILHPDGWTSLLAHHAEQYVRVGETVQQGQVIAKMGNTGTIYVHSHQELRDENGNQLDPLLNLVLIEEEDETMKPVLIRVNEPKNLKVHNRVSYLFPDRERYTVNETEIYRLGRAWGVLKPGQNWAEVVNVIDGAEYQLAIDEIAANQKSIRDEIVADLKASSEPAPTE